MWSQDSNGHWHQDSGDAQFNSKTKQWEWENGTPTASYNKNRTYRRDDNGAIIPTPAGAEIIDEGNGFFSINGKRIRGSNLNYHPETGKWTYNPYRRPSDEEFVKFKPIPFTPNTNTPLIGASVGSGVSEGTTGAISGTDGRFYGYLNGEFREYKTPNWNLLTIPYNLKWTDSRAIYPDPNQNGSIRFTPYAMPGGIGVWDIFGGNTVGTAGYLGSLSGVVSWQWGTHVLPGGTLVQQWARVRALLRTQGPAGAYAMTEHAKYLRKWKVLQ